MKFSTASITVVVAAALAAPVAGSNLRATARRTASVLGSTGNYGLTPQGGYPGYQGAPANVGGGSANAAPSTLPANLQELGLNELKSLLDTEKDKDNKKILKNTIKTMEKQIEEEGSTETPESGDGDGMPDAGTGAALPPLSENVAGVLGSTSNALSEMLAAYGSMSGANLPAMEESREETAGGGSDKKKKKKKKSF